MCTEIRGTFAEVDVSRGALNAIGAEANLRPTALGPFKGEECDLTERGIVYVVTGEKFSRLVLQSIRYLRKVEPDEHVTIVIDEEQIGFVTAQASDLDVELLPLVDPEYRAIDKAKGLTQVNHAQLIYLDADTVPIRPFASDMYRALEFCEVLGLPGMSLNYEWERTDYSPALSQYNGGVIGLSGEAAKNLPAQWEARYKAQENPYYDQASLRATILREGYRVGALPLEFNFWGQGSVKEPRILHFTGVSRRQRFFRSEKLRSELIETFAQPGLEGLFAGFTPAYSSQETNSREGPGRLSWWLAGAGRLIGSRFYAEGRNLLRALARMTRPRNKAK